MSLQGYNQKGEVVLAKEMVVGAPLHEVDPVQVLLPGLLDASLPSDFLLRFSS